MRLQATDKPVNLPIYRCLMCYGEKIFRYPFFYMCPQCNGNGYLTYNEALKIYGKPLALGAQVPQCHICSRFETEDNPLFAYSFFENENGFRFIYRCRQNHAHDIGSTFIDLHTGLEVYL